MGFFNKTKEKVNTHLQPSQEVDSKINYSENICEIVTLDSSARDLIEKDILNKQSELEKLLSKEKSMGEIFKDYYNFNQGSEPRGELMDLFLDIVSKGSENLDETN